MSQSATTPPPAVIDGAAVLLQYPPAILCACGKDGTPYSHGAIREGMAPMSCADVLALAARVRASELAPPGRLARLLRRAS